MDKILTDRHTSWQMGEQTDIPASKYIPIYSRNDQQNSKNFRKR